MKLFIFWVSLIVFSCSETLDINDFSSDFNGYEPEIKIEAIILPSDNTAIVRIDRSFLLNDTTLYDCIDDDGDWVSSTFYCSTNPITVFENKNNCLDACAETCVVQDLNDDLGIDSQNSNDSPYLQPDEDGS